MEAVAAEQTGPGGKRLAVDPEKYVRKLVTIPRAVWKRIEDFRFDRRMRFESDALLHLLRRGLEAEDVAVDEATEGEHSSPPVPAPRGRGRGKLRR